jgi:hypothetical protein
MVAVISTPADGELYKDMSVRIEYMQQPKASNSSLLNSSDM